MYRLIRMGQEMATATLPRQTQVIHGSPLRRFLSGRREVDKFIRLRTSLLLPVRLDQVQVGLPLARNGHVTAVATNGNREVHDVCLLFIRRRFVFLVDRITMKKTTLLVILIIVLAIGFAYLATPADIKMKAIAKDVERDHARFTPKESIDVAMAMGLVTHDPPSMLNPPTEGPPLLLFPPSEETLARMSGE